MTTFEQNRGSVGAIAVCFLVCGLTLLIGFSDLQSVYELLLSNVRALRDLLDGLKGSLEAFRWVH